MGKFSAHGVHWEAEMVEGECSADLPPFIQSVWWPPCLGHTDPQWNLSGCTLTGTCQNVHHWLSRDFSFKTKQGSILQTRLAPQCGNPPASASQLQCWDFRSESPHPAPWVLSSNQIDNVSHRTDHQGNNSGTGEVPRRVGSARRKPEALAGLCFSSCRSSDTLVFS